MTPSQLPVRQILDEAGFTVIELLMTLALIGLIAAMAIPSFFQMIYGIKVDRAITDIKVIEGEILRFKDMKGRLPTTLDELDMHVPFDPFGRPYVYFPFLKKNFRKECRKNKSLNPVNSDFDLYSLGRDGLMEDQIHKDPSLDDIMRISDGEFIGLVEDYF